MKHVWEKSFEVRVPVERAWHVFTDPGERRKLADGPGAIAPKPGEGTRVLESEAPKQLQWTTDGLPDRNEFTVVFEETTSGTRITITRCGFGEGEDAEIFAESNALGWEHGMRDIVVYLETGVVPHRHYNGCARSAFGMSYIQTDAGIEVRAVGAGSFAEHAGLRRGDRVLRVAGAGVFTRSDMWTHTSMNEPGTVVEIEFVRDGALQTAKAAMSPAADGAVGE